MQQYLIPILAVLFTFTACKQKNTEEQKKEILTAQHQKIADSLAKKAISKPKKYESLEETEISFDETKFDFGTIKKSAGKVNHYYTFTNTGDKPLIIEVTPGCGCTVGDYPKDPIAPGAKDSIRLEFNPSAFGGEKINKNATVKGNIKKNVVLLFTADVSNS